MGLLRRVLSGFAALFQGRKLNQEMDEELRSYLDSTVEAKMRSGMSHHDAVQSARVEMGSYDAVKQQVWSVGWESKAETVWQDLRYALRQLRKSPGFTAAVVLSLALGIGGNTAIFSLIDAVMLKFLPVKNPEQLVLLNWASTRWPDLIIHQLSGNFERDKTGRSTSTSFSYPTFQELRRANTTLANSFAFADTGKMNLSADGEAGLAEGELASGDYLSGLGVQPAIGRLFTDFDDKPDSQPTAVISYGYWARRFGRSPLVVGKVITINGIQFTIIGVTSLGIFRIAAWSSAGPLDAPKNATAG